MVKIIFYFLIFFSSYAGNAFANASPNTNINVENHKPFFLSICAVIQNEADYLKEWIEYHKLLGVEHFWIYNNLSTDHYRDVLKPYISTGVVELFDWPYTNFPTCQLAAYTQGIEKSVGRTEWLAVIDLDEFIVPHKRDNLASFLQDFRDYSQILINWQMFGTSYIQSLPKDALIIEHLTYKFPSLFINKWNSNYYVKSIVRPENIVLPVVSQHYFDLKKGALTIDGSGQIVKPSTVTKINIENIQVNHYWFRTIDFFYNVKIGRRENVKETYPSWKIQWLLKAGHSEEDLRIKKFIPALKNALMKTDEKL